MGITAVWLARVAVAETQGVVVFLLFLITGDGNAREATGITQRKIFSVNAIKEINSYFTHEQYQSERRNAT